MTAPRFPSRHYTDISDYVGAYADLTTAGWRSVDRDALRRGADVLSQAYADGRQVFVCGNGGSCAIADHLQCDHLKGICTHTDLSPRVHSLAANTALLTAIANDISYEDVFAYPLQRLAQAGDVLVTISCSGNSPNIIKALECARAHSVTSIGLTGFDGGAARAMADLSLHVDVDNYGIVEDIHQGIMHVLAQFIRQSRIAPEVVGTLRF